MADRALILGDDIGIFLAVARSLGRRGIEVHVAPSDLHAPGLASRYIAAVPILPPYHEAPEAWLDAIRALIAEHDYRLILPCSDAGLAILAHHSGRLGRARLAIPNERALATFTDKSATRVLAAKLGIPVADEKPLCRAAELGFPLVLKPRSSYRLGERQTKRPAIIVRDGAALDRALTEVDADWLAEAFFAGEGVGVSVLARRGEILLAWQHRRLNTISETGASSARTGEPIDPRLLAEVEALVGATQLDGVAMFEFRQHRTSGAHLLLEVNARFWGSLPLALAGGADFPAALWDRLTGAEAAPASPVLAAIIKRSLTGEFDRLASEIASGKRSSLLPLALLLTSRSAGFDSWAADDPAPFHAERRQLLRRMLGGAIRRLGIQPTGTSSLSGRDASASAPRGSTAPTSTSLRP